jgi:hypothetical protein
MITPMYMLILTFRSATPTKVLNDINAYGESVGFVFEVMTETAEGELPGEDTTVWRVGYFDPKKSDAQRMARKLTAIIQDAGGVLVY